MSDALDIKWSKEDGLLSGDPEAMPKLIAAQRLTIAQQAQEMERVNSTITEMDTALDFAHGAIADAIHLDDGLDGAAGEAVMKIIVAVKEHGSTENCDPATIDIMTKHRRQWLDQIDALEQQLAASQARVKELEKECAGLAAGSCEAPYGDDYGNKRCKTIDQLQATLAARERDIAKLKAELNETFVDEKETVWTRPTAWAYAMVCKARDKHEQEAGGGYDKTLCAMGGGQGDMPEVWMSRGRLYEYPDPQAGVLGVAMPGTLHDSRPLPQAAGEGVMSFSYVVIRHDANGWHVSVNDFATTHEATAKTLDEVLKHTKRLITQSETPQPKEGQS